VEYSRGRVGGVHEAIGRFMASLAVSLPVPNEGGGRELVGEIDRDSSTPIYCFHYLALSPQLATRMLDGRNF